MCLQLVPPTHMAEFQALTELMKPDKNSHNYRDALASIPYQEPCLPYLGTIHSNNENVTNTSSSIDSE